MITLKELGYVSSWASKTPYPGIKYAEQTAEKLIESVKNYEKFYKDKEYDLILSNGEQLTFEIMAMNLCHMLGVDYKNLTSEYFQKFREDILSTNYIPRSYELLKLLIDNIDNVLKYDCDNGGKILNYYRVMVKCQIFEKLSDFSKFNFGVINFDKKKYSEIVGSECHINTEKFIYVQSNEQNCPYFMMGLLQDKPKKLEENPIEYIKYAVETMIAPTNARDFFDQQPVTIPTQILITTSDKMEKYEASASEKIALLNQYRALVAEYKLMNELDIYADYMAMLSSQDSELGNERIRRK